METIRLKVKVGAHEFDAEGPADQITAQFTAWKELIAISPAALPATTTTPQGGAPPPTPALRQLDMTAADALLLALFDVDEGNQRIGLKVHPQGEERDADAALLILYAFKKRLSVEEVLVGKLKDSLELTGLRPDRIDRIVDGYIRQGLLLKAGRGPGGKYRLSLTGLQRAEAVAKKIYEQLA